MSADRVWCGVYDLHPAHSYDTPAGRFLCDAAVQGSGPPVIAAPAVPVVVQPEPAEEETPAETLLRDIFTDPAQRAVPVVHPEPGDRARYETWRDLIYHDTGYNDGNRTADAISLADVEVAAAVEAAVAVVRPEPEPMFRGRSDAEAEMAAQALEDAADEWDDPDADETEQRFERWLLARAEQARKGLLP